MKILQSHLLIGLGAAAAFAILGCGGSPGGIPNVVPAPGGTPAPKPTPTPVRPGGAVAVPSGQIYLGALVNPADKKAEAESQTEAFEQQIGRTLALHMHYYRWSDQFPDAAIAADDAYHRIPVITWACQDNAQTPNTNTQIASGQEDYSVIIPRAQAIKRYGKPVLLRWYWEMNLRAGANAQSCMDASGAEGYIKAWKHIHDVFAAQGVTNVAWLWNPSVSVLNDPGPYYPGADYVDWIGIDGYARDKDGGDVKNFADVFSSFFKEFAGAQKPFLVAETGACADAQVPYLQSVQTELTTRYKSVGGFMYFDNPGQYQGCHGSGWGWDLTPDGLSQFKALAADPYFGAP